VADPVAGFAEGDGPLKDVVVIGVIGRRGFGRRDADHVAELGKEHLVVRPLRAALVVLPA